MMEKRCIFDNSDDDSSKCEDLTNLFDWKNGCFNKSKSNSFKVNILFHNDKKSNKFELNDLLLCYQKSFCLFCSFLLRYFGMFEGKSIKLFFSKELLFEFDDKKNNSKFFDGVALYLNYVQFNFLKDISFNDVLSSFRTLLLSSSKKSIKKMKIKIRKKSKIHSSNIINIDTRRDNNIFHIGFFSLHQFEVMTKQLIENSSFGLMFVTDKKTIKLVANKFIFEEDFFDRLCKNFEVFTHSVLKFPNLPILCLEVLSEGELNLILGKVQLNTSSSSSSSNNESINRKGTTLYEEFEYCCKKYGSLVAVEHNSSRLTYSELNSRVNILCIFLKQNHPLLKNNIGCVLGVALEKSINLIICIFACWKLGCVYFPIDPSLPPYRIKVLMEDCGCKIVLCSKSTSKIFSMFSKYNEVVVISNKCFKERPFLSEENISNPEITENSIAYISYTSGSTGKPKAVVHDHFGSINIYSNLFHRLGMKEGDRILLFASISFDEHLNTITTVFHGSTIVICPEEIRYHPKELWNFLKLQNINVLKLTPSVLKSLPQKPIRSLGCVTILGETCDPQVMKFWAGCVDSFVNLYGSQETIVDHTKLWNKSSSLHSRNVGQVMNNYSCWLLDRYLNHVPNGLEGEIYISGPAVSGRGYLNRKELTANRFIQIPCLKNINETGSGTRLFFKTGDFGYFLNNGDLIYCGRKDNMVKINGMRVEISEIEILIMENTLVKDVFVHFLEDKKILVAFIIPNNKYRVKIRKSEIYKSKDKNYCSMDETKSLFDGIRKDLCLQLPYHMIPNLFIRKESFPLNSSGKLDKSKILDLFDLSKFLHQSYVPPATKNEKMMACIFREMLNREEAIGACDDFRSHGGSSLIFLLLKKKIEECFFVDIKFSRFFELSEITVRKLCEIIENLKSKSDEEKDVIELSSDMKSFLIEFKKYGEVIDYENGVGVLYRLMKKSDLEEVVELDIEAWHSNNPLYIHTKFTAEEDRKITPHFIKAAIDEGTGLVAVNVDTDKIIMINTGYSNKAADDCMKNIPKSEEENPNEAIGAAYELAESLIPKQYLIEPIMNAGSLARKFEDQGDFGIDLDDVYYKMELLLQLVGQINGYKTFLDDPNNPITQEHARIGTFPGVVHPVVKFDDFEYPQNSGRFPLRGLKKGYLEFINNKFGKHKSSQVEKILFDGLFFCTRDWRKNLLEC